MRKITDDRFIYRERNEAQCAANYRERGGDAASFSESTRRPPGQVCGGSEGAGGFKAADRVGLATPAALEARHAEEFAPIVSTMQQTQVPLHV